MGETYLPVVTGVAVIGDHVLRLLFSDGMVGDVELSAERWTGVLEPPMTLPSSPESPWTTSPAQSTGPVASTWHPSRFCDQAHAHPLVAA